MPQIDLGKVVGNTGISLRFRGEWNDVAEYVNGSDYIDLATHNGSLWICDSTNTNQEPSGSSEYWSVAAQGMAEKPIIYKSESGDFPLTGEEGTLYVDDTISPALMYIWNGSSYVPAGGTGGGSGDDTFDVSFTLSADGWAGSSAPYAQTASIPGMTSGKAVVYALVSESAQPTAEEQADYQLISGLSQNTDSVTFYADAIPAGDMVIRAFCGAGTEETADLSVIAAPFYAQKDYTTGERCINEGKLWKFTDNKPAGAWDSTKVESTTVDAELTELQGKVDELNSRIQVEDISADCLTALKGDMTINYAVRRGTHYSIGAIFRNLGGLAGGEIANLKQEYVPAETTAFCAYAFTTGSSHACASGWITGDGSLYFSSVGNAVTLAIGIEYDVVS